MLVLPHGFGVGLVARQQVLVLDLQLQQLVGAGGIGVAIEADFGAEPPDLATHLTQPAVDLLQPRIDPIAFVSQRGQQRVERGLLGVEVVDPVGGEEGLVAGVGLGQPVLKHLQLLVEIGLGLVQQHGAPIDQVFVEQPVQHQRRSVGVGVGVGQAHHRRVGRGIDLQVRPHRRDGPVDDLLALGGR